MLPHLEQDVQLRDRFFEQLQLIFYAAAALPQDLWDRLQAVSIKSRGRTTVLTSAWGSTETAPLATSAHFPLDHAGNIGVPVPGAEPRAPGAGPRRPGPGGSGAPGAGPRGLRGPRGGAGSLFKGSLLSPTRLRVYFALCRECTGPL